MNNFFLPKDIWNLIINVSQDNVEILSILNRTCKLLYKLTKDKLFKLCDVITTHTINRTTQGFIITKSGTYKTKGKIYLHNSNKCKYAVTIKDVDNVFIDDLYIVLNKYTNYAINIDNCKNIRINTLTVEGARDGQYGLSTNNLVGIDIRIMKFICVSVGEIASTIKNGAITLGEPIIYSQDSQDSQYSQVYKPHLDTNLQKKFRRQEQKLSRRR